MVVTIILSGFPQYVTLEDLARGLDKCLKSDRVGTFFIRDLSVRSHSGKNQVALDFKNDQDAKEAQHILDKYEYKLPNDRQYTLKAKITRDPDLMPLPKTDDGGSSLQPVYNKAVIAHNSRRAATDKRHEEVDDEILKLRKQLLLHEKNVRLSKAEKKLAKAKKKKKRQSSESESSDSDSDERRKKRKKKKKKRVRSSSSSSDSTSSSSPAPAPSTSRGKIRSSSARRPRSSSISSDSSTERKKRRRLTSSSKVLDRVKRTRSFSSPDSRRRRRSRLSRSHSRSSPVGRSGRSPPDRRSRRSPYDERAHRRYESYARYVSHSDAYSARYDRRDSGLYRRDPAVVFVDRSNPYRAPSATVTEIHDDYEEWSDENKECAEQGEQNADDDVQSVELEEGEVDDDDDEPSEPRKVNITINVIPKESADKGRDRSPESRRKSKDKGSPDTRRRTKKMPLPMKKERMTDDDIRRAMPKPIMVWEPLIIKAEKEKPPKPKRISPNPKFVIPVKKILREMRFFIKGLEENVKDRCIDIVCVILRLRMKDILQGKEYMHWRDIMKLYREFYDSEHDGKLVAEIVSTIQAGGFASFVASDDDDQPENDQPEDFTEFLPYVEKWKSDENKENKAKNDEDVIVLEKNFDVIEITDVEEAERKLLEKIAKKDASEAAKKDKQTEDLPIKMEPDLSLVKEEKDLAIKEPVIDIPDTTIEETASLSNPTKVEVTEIINAKDATEKVTTPDVNVAKEEPMHDILDTTIEDTHSLSSSLKVEVSETMDEDSDRSESIITSDKIIPDVKAENAKDVCVKSEKVSEEKITDEEKNI